MTMRVLDSGRPETRVERCRGEGCGLPHPEDVMEDGVCPGCSKTQAVCEHCSVLFDRAVMERVDPSDLVCGECADAAHAEAERAEGAGEAMGLHLAEAWK